MTELKYIIIVVLGYLLGSFCASIPISKKVYGTDVRNEGSGNAGATNAARVFGMKAGLATLLCDAAKTAIAMLIGAYLCGEVGKAVAGAACIIGHCFPIYFGFKGGKGVSVAAALGLFTGLPVFAVIACVFFLTAGLSKKVSLGSICAAVALPLATLIFACPKPVLFMNIFAGVLVIVMHRQNIVRLINGTEADFKPKKCN